MIIVVNQTTWPRGFRAHGADLISSAEPTLIIGFTWSTTRGTNSTHIMGEHDLIVSMDTGGLLLEGRSHMPLGVTSYHIHVACRPWPSQWQWDLHCCRIGVNPSFRSHNAHILGTGWVCLMTVGSLGSAWLRGTSCSCVPAIWHYSHCASPPGKLPQYTNLDLATTTSL